MFTILPVPLRNHVTACQLRKTENTGQVNLNHGVPIGFRVINSRRAADGAGVVYQNIEPAKVIEGFSYQPLRRLWIA